MHVRLGPVLGGTGPRCPLVNEQFMIGIDNRTSENPCAIVWEVLTYLGRPDHPDDPDWFSYYLFTFDHASWWFPVIELNECAMRTNDVLLEDSSYLYT